jgi:hypothetical protein
MPAASLTYCVASLWAEQFISSLELENGSRPSGPHSIRTHLEYPLWRDCPRSLLG